MVTAAALAHEIKGPLSLIKAKLQLMETDKAEAGKYSLIYSQIEKINSILLEFIGLAKPREYEFEETDLRGILEKCLGAQKAGRTAHVGFRAGELCYFRGWAEAGDGVLQYIAERVRGCGARRGHQGARQGGQGPAGVQFCR